MKQHRTNEVFVPGGTPTLTYVPRTQLNLEERLAEAKDNLCKLVTVTGATKSGKSVLASKVFPRNQSIWINGGAVKTEDDFWNFILVRIGGYNEEAKGHNAEAGQSFSGEVAAAAHIPFVAEGKGSFSTGLTKKRAEANSKKLSLSPRAAAINQLIDARLTRCEPHWQSKLDLPFLATLRNETVPTNSSARNGVASNPPPCLLSPKGRICHRSATGLARNGKPSQPTPKTSTGCPTLLFRRSSEVWLPAKTAARSVISLGGSGKVAQPDEV